ncbi:LytTR family transcriptional regulator [Sphingomonas sp. ID1715]|uniref:LytR/AlgR family response regulator transcription factor n=1 Tax=Sphingomonas sp. ID1715 TaxID=1656898 RepID=UPI00148A0570|nr:LytTR family DNA-binding domain-containing protein [Sphingomonas sp. ID1715]NNM76849.1 LytTR family transcriptional regulator [Sphingomonas sp. ID1715]
MLSLLQRVPARERLRIACALAFWAATYLLFLAWNQLQDQFPSAIWQTRRVLATALGALLFYGFTLFADRVAVRPLKDRIPILLGAGLACCALMIAGRAGIDRLVVLELGEPPSTFERHLRFALIWAGYFLGGSLAFLSFAPLLPSPSRGEEQPPAEPIPNGPAYADAFWVSRGRETVRVDAGDIDWVEAEGDYVRLHARGGGGLLRATLSGLEAQLDPNAFARVHRSAVCRRSAIVALLRKPSGALAVRLTDGQEVPVGRSYRDSVTGIIGKQRDKGRIPA